MDRLQSVVDSHPFLTAEPTDVPSQGPSVMRHLRPLKRHHYHFTALGHNNTNGMRNYEVGLALIFQDPEIMYLKRTLKTFNIF